MALSKMHVSIDFLAMLRKGKGISTTVSEWSKTVPYLLLPDAIRCFNFGAGIPNNRVISHFEIHPVTGRSSWMKFPSIEQIRVLDEEIISKLEKSYEGDYSQVAIGDETSINAFLNHNANLDEPVKLGCYKHLCQDRVYDQKIRELIDCSKRHENGLFFFKGNTYDAKSVRTLITQIEEIEFRTLCKLIDDEFGVEINQTFFEKFVKTAIDEAYCPKMAETTWKFIRFSSDELPNLVSEERATEVIEAMVAAV